jgi:hypothetical protein
MSHVLYLPFGAISWVEHTRSVGADVTLGGLLIQTVEAKSLQRMTARIDFASM